MITKITGKLVHLTDIDATIAAGPFEYQVLIPDFVRRQLQGKIGENISLRTVAYLDGNPQQGRLTPRLIGFMSEAEKEFFDQICSVDGVGVKKALRAMVRPVREVATAIEEQDVKELSTLPGIGPAVAERIVAKLRRKMARFALMVPKALPSGEDATEPTVIEETYQALLSLGHTNVDARQKIEEATQQGKKKFKTVEDLIREIYNRQRK